MNRMRMHPRFFLYYTGSHTYYGDPNRPSPHVEVRSALLNMANSLSRKPETRRTPQTLARTFLRRGRRSTNKAKLDACR